ncbi:MAG: glycine--tRNA ligase subunit beta [bacterium]|nr:glycine--tRNA ligase subunit beta [bacterium]
MSDFLFELGVEEVPVSEIVSILTKLKEKLLEGLKKKLVEHKYVETAVTNKRFMIYIAQINTKANDIEEQIKGPAKRIAYDENGAPTIPLQKFLEFNDVREADLKELETKKGIYMVIDRKTAGRPTAAIVQEMLPRILGELNFAKAMVWNESRVPFVRPIKSILALFDNNIVPIEFAGVQSSNITYGHILLSDGPLEVNSFKDYCELLAKNFVIEREDERRKKIIDEITYVEEDFNANIKPDTDMLDDYIYNNEYPVVFHGKFDEKYLALPSEIISTFMIKEKKLLPVFDKKNNLLNVFIGVSNIPDENKNVSSGNEKVIKATFEDAKFFWDNDRKDNIVSLREQLKNVAFHKGLGSFYEKTDRLFSLVSYLVKETKNDDIAESLKKAALYCKNDLVTRMVREFPSLQGVMGGLYLKEAGAEESMWKAVYGHYEPKGFHKKKLENQEAGLLSIADKIDNIAGFISKGIKISSSKDPYGIRRDANAIVKVMLDFKLGFDLNDLIKLAVEQFTEPENEPSEEVIKKITTLFFGRIESIFKEFLKFRYDVVNSILNRDTLYIFQMYARGHCVSKIVQNDSIDQLVALHKRIKNIIRKFDRYLVHEELLEQEEEKILLDIFKESKLKIETSIINNDFLRGCSQFLEMKPVIDNFFEKVLVMAKDENVRNNRIALLQRMDELLSQIADFSLIVDAK